MKIVSVCISCFLLLSIAGENAKAQYKKTITVKAGSTINETFSKKELYHYPEFVTGTVYFKDGSATNSLLNYSLIQGEMQFIDQKNDTLAIANEATIRYIVINRDSFFYFHGYLELCKSHPVVKLAKMERIVLTDRQKIGAYGMASSASSIESYDKIFMGTYIQKLAAREDLIFHWVTDFFIGDQANNFNVINRKNLVKMFPAYRKPIETYFKENNVNVLKEEDVLKLVTFLQNI